MGKILYAIAINPNLFLYHVIHLGSTGLGDGTSSWVLRIQQLQPCQAQHCVQVITTCIKRKFN